MDFARRTRQSRLDGSSVAALLAQSRNEGRSGPNEYWAKAVVEAFGVPIPAGRLVAVEEIDSNLGLDDIPEPFALKFMSPSVLHKSDVGAVQLGLSSQDLPAAMRAMLNSSKLVGLPCDGFLVESMADIQQELVLGGINDATFGPVVMLGFGGVLTELLDDVVFRICPIDEFDVMSMLQSLRGYAVLEGYRGTPSVAMAAVIDAVLAVAGPDGLLMKFSDDIAELDVNPLAVSSSGVIAADVRLVLSQNDSAYVGGETQE